MPRVNIPGIGAVNFPDTMALEEIQGHSTRLAKQAQLEQSTAQPDVIVPPDPLHPLNVLSAAQGTPTGTALAERLGQPMGQVSGLGEYMSGLGRAFGMGLAKRFPLQRFPMTAPPAPGAGRALPPEIAWQVQPPLGGPATGAVPGMAPPLGPLGRSVRPSGAIEPPAILPPRGPAMAEGPIPPALAGPMPTAMDVARLRAGIPSPMQRPPGLLDSFGHPILSVTDDFGEALPARPPTPISLGDDLVPTPPPRPVGELRRETPAPEPPTPGAALRGAFQMAREQATETRGRLGSAGEGARPQPAPPTTLQSAEQLLRFFDQRGGVTPETAARVGLPVGGAVAGALVGETPEERIGGAVVGGLAGAIGARSLLGRRTPVERRAAAVGERLEKARTAQTTTLPRSMIGAKETQAVQEALTRAPVPLGRLDELVAAADDALRAVGETPKPGREPITFQIMRAAKTQPRVISILQQNLQARGATLLDFAETLVSEPTTAKAALGQLRGLSHILERAARTDPQASAILRDIVAARPSVSGWALANHFLLRAQNVWLGLLVSAWKTSARNIVTQQARVGVEVIEHGMTNGVLRAAGQEPTALGQLKPGRFAMDYLASLDPRVALGFLRNLERNFPIQKDRLVLSFASDVAEQMSTSAGGGVLGLIHPRGQGILGPGFATVQGTTRPLTGAAATADRIFDGLQTGTEFANALNLSQEILTRAAFTRAQLLQKLAQKGVRTLDEIDPRIFTDDEIGEMVNGALKVTFAGEPAWTQARTLLQAMAQSAPKSLAVRVGLGVPFVRYMFNAAEFLAERPFTSTVPAMRTAFRLLTRRELDSITAGDAKALSKFTTGMMMWLGGYAWARSQFAGPDPQQVQNPDGSVWDLRPFGPFSTYFMTARFINELNEGQLNPERVQKYGRFFNELKERGEVLRSTEATVDAVLELAGGEWFTMDTERLERNSRALRRFGGEMFGGLGQPLTTVRDLFAAYGQYLPGFEEAARQEGLQRETRAHPFTGPILERLPGAGRAFLPEKEAPLRAATPPREVPFAPFGIPLPAQLTGIVRQEQTPAETTAARLDLRYPEIAGAPTGEPLADIAQRRFQGELQPLWDTLAQALQGMDPETQRFLFTTFLERARTSVGPMGRMAVSQTPEELEAVLGAHLRRSLDPRLRELIRRRGAPVPR